MAEGRVAIVGGGVAGVAAAWAARGRGLRVTLYHSTAGASELGSGAADLTPWSEVTVTGATATGATVMGATATGDTATGDTATGELREEERRFLEALDHWRFEPALVATASGVIRPCAAHDAALLPLHSLAGSTIAVAALDRDDWDADLLARALTASRWAERTGTQFRAEPLALLEAGHERRITVTDFAALHDVPERRARLIEALRAWQRRQSGYAALLCGPWLGIEPETLGEVRSAVDLPVGECTSPPGGPSGARFARARDRLLGALGIEVRQERVLAIRPGESSLSVESERGDGLATGVGRETEAFDRVILCIGGLVSGGLEFAPEQGTGAAFRLNLEAPVSFSVSGEPLEHVSSAHGFDPTTLRGRWIERAGILADAKGRTGATGLVAAGDVIAGRPRTVLEALRSGLRAVEAVVETL